MSKGYGFVSFMEPRCAQAAVGHLDGLIIDGKKLTVRLKTAAHEHNQRHLQQYQYASHQQHPQQLGYQPQPLQQQPLPPLPQSQQHRTRSPMLSHPSMHERSPSVSSVYSSPPRPSAMAHPHSFGGVAAGAHPGLADLSASLGGLNLGSSAPSGSVNGGNADGNFFHATLSRRMRPPASTRSCSRRSTCCSCKDSKDNTYRCTRNLQLHAT
jgi:hypothetical protein